MPGGKIVRLLGRERPDFEPGEHVQFRTGKATGLSADCGEFAGYAYGSEWETGIVMRHDGGEVLVPLADLVSNKAHLHIRGPLTEWPYRGLLERMFKS